MWEEKQGIISGFLHLLIDRHIALPPGFKTQWMASSSEFQCNSKGCDEVTG